MWSDPDLVPYMAITAHWIEAQWAVWANGSVTEELILHSELIGFMEVPRHHTGEHLAAAFLHIVE
ncbi:hypothetical protein NEOLEDRAFT_1066627 [Neolentinus lepideus HHB14362 ss-1]|uniref:Uncharacterized protein n=1 Tax=Neolentinus lepideus HHB14362 ss-1 TaxID=1314782 RepID=A0A165S6I8_9AGAM|nr:hypothetical protein NEOLEDRAFT_1066627 [Neolentinus lepideus HHB14362 ss-1]